MSQEIAQKTVLSNGIRVVTEFIPTVRSVSVGVWALSGSRDEQVGEEGITHFIEHMVFKGTERRSMRQIASYLESVGGYLNAFTGKESTCYYARALDSHADRAIQLLLDLVLAPTFPEKEIEKEKEVVIEEMKMYEDDPEEAIFDLLERSVYGAQAMGNPIIGFEETVRAFSRVQLLDYVARQYTPDRILVSVSGNIQHDKVVKIVERMAATCTRTTGKPLNRVLAPAQPQKILQSKPIQQAHLLVGTRCSGIWDERRNALSVLNTMLSGGMSSRLNLNIREKYGYCYNIYSSLNVFGDVGDFSVYMGTDTRKIDRAKDLIYKELRRFVEEPIPHKLLTQAKQQIKAGMMFELEGTTNRMMRIARGEMYFERFFSPEEIEAEIDAVQPEEVQAVAATLFDLNQFSEIVYLPQAS